MPIAADLYYFSHESQDNSVKRPPLILIHGAGGSYISWPAQIRRLEGERIFALDLPGHGQSEGVGRHSVDEYAEDVIAFMKALKIRAAVLVGISMGSAIALTVALKYPKKVLGLGLLGGGAKLRVAPPVLEWAANPNTFESAVDMVNENCFSEGAPQSLLALSKKQMMEIRPPVFHGDLLACNEFDVIGQLEKMDLPALIICGAEDKMTPVKFSELLKSRIANSQLHVIEHAGHMVMLEQPDRIAELLKEFVDNLPQRVRKTKQPRIAAPAQQPEPPLEEGS
ncbi:alpha/beta hydrolase [Candidatus Villigracilis saccharophilus]|uniref:alpha/beta fold hydrolase n=1 Tax=Candidatus Villigracilis saccharophilus TaxID=3140684 RepID=UPI00313690C7|nr:alpha/beta hydrolase [Anaerolineales bacterium]